MSTTLPQLLVRVHEITEIALDAVVLVAWEKGIMGRR